MVAVKAICSVAEAVSSRIKAFRIKRSAAIELAKNRLSRDFGAVRFSAFSTVFKPIAVIHTLRITLRGRVHLGRMPYAQAWPRHGDIGSVIACRVKTRLEFRQRGEENF